MNSLDIKRFQKAFEKGRQDALSGTHTLEIAEDEKEYEFYIRGRKDVGEKAAKPEVSMNYMRQGYDRQTAEDITPLPIIL